METTATCLRSTCYACVCLCLGFSSVSVVFTHFPSRVCVGARSRVYAKLWMLFMRRIRNIFALPCPFLLLLLLFIFGGRPRFVFRSTARGQLRSATSLSYINFNYLAFPFEAVAFQKHFAIYKLLATTMPAAGKGTRPKRIMRPAI